MWLVGQFATAAKSNVFFDLDVGLMEDPTEENVRYVEVYADHDPVHWRRTLPDALMAALVR